MCVQVLLLITVLDRQFLFLFNGENLKFNKKEFEEGGMWSTVVRTGVDYETIKREVNRRLIYEFRCDERLKGKTEGSTRLT